jgi:hypothetical protein
MIVYAFPSYGPGARQTTQEIGDSHLFLPGVSQLIREKLAKNDDGHQFLVLLAFAGVPLTHCTSNRHSGVALQPLDTW